MRKALLALILVWGECATAAVINFEVQFTPFTGDIAKSEVQTVAGKASVFLNNVPIAEQDVEKKSVPVLFDNREIAPAVWVPVKSLGGLVRKGKNTLQIEFVPSDANAAYQSRLQWNEVNDHGPGAAQRRIGHFDEPRRRRNGDEEEPGQGRLRKGIRRRLRDRAAVAQVPVGRLAQRRRQAEARALVKERADAFKPKFEAIYQILGSKPEIQVAEIRKIDASRRRTRPACACRCRLRPNSSSPRPEPPR
jgi:hypothetical protein